MTKNKTNCGIKIKIGILEKKNGYWNEMQANFEKRIAMLNENLANTVKMAQGFANRLVCSDNTGKIESLMKEIKTLKSEKNRLEDVIMKGKLGFMEERTILQNQIKHAEELVIDLKMKYAQTSLDKDYYLIKYKDLIQECKNKGWNIK